MRRSAAEIFAFSLLEVFPDVQLIGGCETVYGFSYDFKAPFHFQEVFLRMIEEKMREVVKKGLLIEQTEMMPENSAQLFEHQNQCFLAQQAREASGNFTPILRIGEFAALGTGPFLHTTDELGPFKLLEIKNEKGKTRVFGAVCADSKELKREIKKGSPLTNKNHLDWGRELDLFSPSPLLDEGHFIWHPEGLALCKRLKEVWPKEKFHPISTATAFSSYPKLDRLRHFSSFFQTHPTTPALVEWNLEHNPKEARGAGMLTPKVFTTDRVFTFCEESQLSAVCFSSLQLIIKILKILSFEFRVVVHTCDSQARMEPLLIALKRGEWVYQEVPGHSRDPWIEVLIADGEGQYWKNSRLELVSLREGKQKTTGIACSMFVKLERTVALLLESHEGALPFWLAPKQIRLLVVAEKASSYAKRLEEEFERGGYRVEVISTSKERLSSEMHQGLAQKIPYILVVGKREHKSETVTIRKRNSKEKKTMKLADFFEMLQSREERI